MTPDSIAYSDPDDPQSLNLYSYVGNHPTILIDPDGRCWWQWLCNTQAEPGRTLTDTFLARINSLARYTLPPANSILPGESLGIPTGITIGGQSGVGLDQCDFFACGTGTAGGNNFVSSSPGGSGLPDWGSADRNDPFTFFVDIAEPSTGTGFLGQKPWGPGWQWAKQAAQKAANAGRHGPKSTPPPNVTPTKGPPPEQDPFWEMIQKMFELLEHGHGTTIFFIMPDREFYDTNRMVCGADNPTCSV